MNRNDTTLYLVYWYKHDVLKVGITGGAERLRTHSRSGAVLLHSIDHVTAVQERAAIEHVGFAFDRAFEDAASAVPVLGRHGIGYTECFRVPTRHLTGAVELAFMGVRRGAHEANPNDQA